LWRFAPLAGPEPAGFGDCRPADFSSRRQSFEKINGISGSSQASAAEVLVKARGFCPGPSCSNSSMREKLFLEDFQKPDHRFPATGGVNAGAARLGTLLEAPHAAM
jgi:hypothetical protein